MEANNPTADRGRSATTTNISNRCGYGWANHALQPWRPDGQTGISQSQTASSGVRGRPSRDLRAAELVQLLPAPGPHLFLMMPREIICRRLLTPSG